MSLIIKNPVATFTTHDDGTVTMKLEMERETDGGVFKVTIPKISLNQMEVKSEESSRLMNYFCPSYNLHIPLLPDKESNFVTMKTIERKMSLSEIEEALGYKVVLTIN